VITVRAAPCDVRGRVPAKRADHHGVRPTALAAPLVDRLFRIVVDLAPPLRQTGGVYRVSDEGLTGFSVFLLTLLERPVSLANMSFRTA